MQTQAWRHGRRRDRREHRHRPRARLPRSRLPMRHLHAKHAEPREDRLAAHAGRGGTRGASGTVRRRAQLQPPSARLCARYAGCSVDGPVRQYRECGRALPYDWPGDLGADAGYRRCVRRGYWDWRHARRRRAVFEGEERWAHAGVACGSAGQRAVHLCDEWGEADGEDRELYYRRYRVSPPPCPLLDFSHPYFFNAGVCASLGIGIGQGRVTNNLGTFIDKLDGALHIADEKSIAMVYDLLDSEGIYIGASSALNVVAAYELAQKLGPGKVSTFCARCLWFH